jgi:hypothetical protein
MNALNLVFLVLALLSIAISIFLFILSRKTRRIAFLKTDAPFKIFDSESSTPKLRVLDQNDELITDNIYLSEILLWNSGDVPIEPADVRDSISVRLFPCKKILDYKILHQERPEIANIVLRENHNPDNSNEKILIFGWSHLDPGFGAKVQIIFVGTEETEISVNGYVVGIPMFTDESRERIYRYLPESLQFLATFLPAGVGLVCFLTAVLILNRVITDPSLVAMLSTIVSLSFAFGFGTLVFRKNRPPF